MPKSPLYHPVRIKSGDPFGAKIQANSAVNIVSATAKMYGSGVIRSKSQRKNEVIVERSVRGLESDEVAREPEFGGTLGVGIETNVSECQRTSTDSRLRSRTPRTRFF